MTMCDRWQARTALLMALGMVSVTAAPGVSMALTPTGEPMGDDSYRVAQTLFDSAQLSVPAGTTIQTTYDETGDDGEAVERIILSPDERAEITLTVAESVRSQLGTELIPAGSEIEGELRPIDGDTMGTQFYAETLVLPDGQRIPMDGVSQPVTTTETITEETDPDFIKGAVIGAAAAAVLAEILGSIDLLEVLGGAGLGALGILIFGGGEEEVEVVVVDPDVDLDVTLQSDLRL